MNVLVTGGAGFIGANLVRHLCDDPSVRKIVVLDDLSSGYSNNLDGIHNEIEFVTGDVRDERTLDRTMAGVAAVVHLGAIPSVPRSVQDPITSHDVNVTGTLRVLEAARRVGGAHVVLASSSAVYGDDPTMPKHEGLVPMPASPYAASKLAAEAYVLSYAAVYDLPVLAFRFFNVFGPLQPAGHAYAAVIPAFVDAALSGRPLAIHGDGRQTRDFTYVGSVVAVLADAIRRRVTSDKPVNLAFGSRRSVLELVAELERVLERPVEVVHTDPRPGDVRDSQADQSRLRELFPFMEDVPFAEGLRATVEWFARVKGSATCGHSPTRG